MTQDHSAAETWLAVYKNTDGPRAVLAMVDDLKADARASHMELRDRIGALEEEIRSLRAGVFADIGGIDSDEWEVIRELRRVAPRSLPDLPYGTEEVAA